MSREKPNTSRRIILRSIGFGGGLSLVPAASAVESCLESISENRLREVAVEAAPHPSKPVIAFTTITEDEGYQLYVARGTESINDKLAEENVVKLTDADAGVHGLEWTHTQWLKYSVDDRTVERQVRFHMPGDIPVAGNERVVSDEPRPLKRTGAASEGDIAVQSIPDIPYPIDCKDGGNVCCTDVPFIPDWCVRAERDDGHSPECRGETVPAMEHAHVAIFPEGDYRSGVNIWAGYDGRCVWVGEEHYSRWCTNVCASSQGEMPSVSDLRDAFEEAIERALDAAGIAAPAVVVAALAYFLAVTTVTPPAPGVPIF